MTSSPTRVSSIEHRLTPGEVVPVLSWQLRQRPQNFILPAVGAALVIAVVVVLAVDSGSTEAWTVMLALGLVILVIFYVLVPLTPGRIWKRFGSQFQQRTPVISDEGIQRHTALNDSMLRWPTFTETVVKDGLYLLRGGKGPGCFIIPTPSLRLPVRRTRLPGTGRAVHLGPPGADGPLTRWPCHPDPAVRLPPSGLGPGADSVA